MTFNIGKLKRTLKRVFRPSLIIAARHSSVATSATASFEYGSQHDVTLDVMTSHLTSLMTLRDAS